MLAARAYLAFGVLAVALNAALGGSNAVYNSVGLASAVAILAGTALHRPRAWRAWVGIGMSQALFGFGDIAFGSGAATPSFADALYLGGDAFLIVSMGWLFVSAGGGRKLTSHLDALLLALIVGVCGWALFASSAMSDGSLVSRAVSISYPMCDLVLLALLVRVVFVRGNRAPSYWVLLGAVVLLFVADGGAVMPLIGSTYQAGGWLDAGWLLSYVLFGVAALHPSMTRLVEPRHAEGPSLPVRRAFVLGLGLIAVPSAMIIPRATGSPANGLGDEIAMVVIAAAVVLRGGFLVRELERLRRKAEQSERRFRMVFERAPIGISIGRDGVMSETNPALQRMLGYSGSEFARMHYTDVTHPDDQDLVQQIELDAGTRDAFAVDKRYRHKDGSSIDAHVHVALDLEDGLGISLVEDVTGRRELEDQLRQAQKMDSIGKLAGGIAHDFNNLMTAVMGYSDLLMQQVGTDESARKKIDAIHDSAVRASDLTRQLLAFSRRQILQMTEIDLRDVVKRMDTLLTRLIGDDVRLHTLYGSEPVIVRADQTQLEQVVMNLAVNARDAMPEGGTLTVAVLSDGDSAILSVIDDGVGMDDETRARIFEPFFTTKSLAESSGLGLATVYGIVGQSGGSIDVDSAAGRGTVFTIRLPLVVGAESLPVEAVLLPVQPVLATLVD
ncbi:MAG: two-component system, cell cycle sensor histidine kinase and response regulator CckA [Gaiellaceae bacterium]|nr:two-component system, cell cycle sensor histidine kinase and response regulator CckA [Gaiellaceae bacterium]